MILVEFVCAAILFVQQSEIPKTEVKFLSPCSEKEVSEIQRNFSILDKPIQYPIITKEQEKLIKQLGADRFLDREEASKKLQEMGLEGVLLLEKVETKNKETKKRINIIIENYYDVYFREEEFVYNYNNQSEFEEDSHTIRTTKIFPSIWCLSNEWRFQENEDISKKYFAQAKIIYNDFAKSKYDQLASESDQIYPIVKDEIWLDEDVEKIATQLLIIDLLQRGVPQIVTIKILSVMEFNSHYMEREVVPLDPEKRTNFYNYDNKSIPLKFSKQSAWPH